MRKTFLNPNKSQPTDIRVRSTLAILWFHSGPAQGHGENITGLFVVPLVGVAVWSWVVGGQCFIAPAASWFKKKFVCHHRPLWSKTIICTPAWFGK